MATQSVPKRIDDRDKPATRLEELAQPVDAHSALRAEIRAGFAELMAQQRAHYDDLKAITAALIAEGRRPATKRRRKDG